MSPVDDAADGHKSELTSLCWDHFSELVSTGLCELMHCEELLDVTLSCEGESFQVHRLVLAICSPYFREIFKAQSGKHPTIVLCGINRADLRSLLQFMYRGKISLSKEQLEGFLTAGNLLQIKGVARLQERSSLDLDSSGVTMVAASQVIPPMLPSLKDHQQASSSQSHTQGTRAHKPAAVVKQKSRKPRKTNKNPEHRYRIVTGGACDNAKPALFVSPVESKLQMDQSYCKTNQLVNDRDEERNTSKESMIHPLEMQKMSSYKVIQKILQEIEKLKDYKFLQRLANLQELQFLQDLVKSCEYLAQISSSYGTPQFYKNDKDCLSEKKGVLDSFNGSYCKPECVAYTEGLEANNSTPCLEDATELFGEIQIWSPSLSESGLEEFTDVECKSCGDIFKIKIKSSNTPRPDLSPGDTPEDLLTHTLPRSNNVQCNNCLYYLSSDQWHLVTVNTK